MIIISPFNLIPALFIARIKVLIYDFSMSTFWACQGMEFLFEYIQLNISQLSAVSE